MRYGYGVVLATSLKRVYIDPPPGRFKMDISVSGRPPARSEGAAPHNKKQTKNKNICAAGEIFEIMSPNWPYIDPFLFPSNVQPPCVGPNDHTHNFRSAGSSFMTLDFLSRPLLAVTGRYIHLCTRGNGILVGPWPPFDCFLFFVFTRPPAPSGPPGRPLTN